MGCPARKLVEQDTNDTSFSIVTYEGIHSHDSPYGKGLNNCLSQVCNDHGPNNMENAAEGAKAVINVTKGHQDASLEDEGLHPEYPGSPEASIGDESQAGSGQSEILGERRDWPNPKKEYAVKTKSEVAILDDGYKWRKYGKKMVNNSPYPRVQVDKEDPSYVITTYKGIHNHQSASDRANCLGSGFGIYDYDHRRICSAVFGSEKRFKQQPAKYESERQ
ncbi:DNA-binding WRKY [Corchorus olitorius]|uniref:DNA-binding WRKY n=1 Tax=Corchorus olitorius TaxID=93759 RepID=A0A1R3HIB9_9ROSI|nr:DNA-binding WRKY [Corchorus olitorius]